MRLKFTEISHSTQRRVEPKLENSVIGDWQIESVMGAPVVDGSAKLNFAEGGKVAGNNSCNNFFGQYTVEGDKVKLMPKGSTMMMCPST